jgi:hypothetical protein
MKYYLKQNGVYIELNDNIPVNSSFVEIPEKRPDDTYDWNGLEWVKSDRENMLHKQMRATAYKEEADSLFFKAQRGEIEMQVWLNKVAEIKERYK